MEASQSTCVPFTKIGPLKKKKVSPLTQSTCRALGSYRTALMMILDPLPNLYTTYSDKMESEDYENIAVRSQGEGKSELYNSDSTHISVSEGSQHLGTSTPWDAMQDDACLEEYGSNTTNTLDSSSDISEPCLASSDFTISSDFSQPPLLVIENKPCATFASKNPNLHHQTHPKINGEIIFIPTISAANFVDKENLVNETVAT